MEKKIALFMGSHIKCLVRYYKNQTKVHYFFFIFVIRSTVSVIVGINTIHYICEI